MPVPAILALWMHKIDIISSTGSFSVVCSPAVWLPGRNWLWVNLLARNKAQQSGN